MFNGKWIKHKELLINLSQVISIEKSHGSELYYITFFCAGENGTVYHRSANNTLISFRIKKERDMFFNKIEKHIGNVLSYDDFLYSKEVVKIYNDERKIHPTQINNTKGRWS